MDIMRMSLDQVLGLDPSFFKGADLSFEEVMHLFKVCDAAWKHSGDPKNPHAKLTSGWCSDGFFDCLRVLKYSVLSDILANQMARKIREQIGDTPVDWVIGSPMAGITFAHDVARALGAPISMFVEKDPVNSGQMLWKRMVIPRGANVLQVEELTTTAKTLNAVQGAVDIGNPTPVNWLPYISILVHRPPTIVERYGDRMTISLIETEIWAVPPEQCPLCAQGSARYRPKTHWDKLTGKK